MDGEEPTAEAGEITSLLQRWRGGDSEALERLTPLVYDELKRLARAALRGRGAAATLQPTALVSELYVRLLGRPGMRIADREHFFALAARVLRQVLVDRARERAAAKRGAGLLTVGLDGVEPAAPAPQVVDLLDLDRALGKLREREPRMERLVELRYFGGLTLEEAAAVLDRSEASLSRDWTLARAFLFRELHPAGAAPAPSGPS
jgi:RNA polymerase sigma factor (TIGR02999 family)